MFPKSHTLKSNLQDDEIRKWGGGLGPRFWSERWRHRLSQRLSEPRVAEEDPIHALRYGNEKAKKGCLLESEHTPNSVPVAL